MLPVSILLPTSQGFGSGFHTGQEACATPTATLLKNSPCLAKTPSSNASDLPYPKDGLRATYMKKRILAMIWLLRKFSYE